MQISRRTGLFLSLIVLIGLGFLVRAHLLHAKDLEGTGPALTIYNQQFAVVRQGMSLNLREGTNHIDLTDITGHLEPDSVILRSLDGGRQLKILEQNYRNDPLSQQLLLSLYEGKTIDFVMPDKQIVKGQIIRSGFVPHSASAYSMYGQGYYQTQMAYAQNGGGEPVIEVNGQLQFTLPGQPIFPALADDTILKPTLSWELATNKPGTAPAELSYVTGGMNWASSYNVVAPASGNDLEMVGWVTLDNQSGKIFRDARIKLMAGDVNKVQPGTLSLNGRNFVATRSESRVVGGPVVTERAFDEYHLYTLENSTTLHDRETKQVEFVRAAGIQSKTVYVYDGLRLDQNDANWTMETIRGQEGYGVLSNPKLWVMQEFKNSKDNHLGVPLPKGRVRFYRHDQDGQLEFTGENEIDHTPKDEMIRIYTGNSFDLTGERRRLNYKMDSNARWVDESFEVKVRNHKISTAEVRIVEHLYRWTNWDISRNSDPLTKLDSQTIAFTVEIPPDVEKTVDYQVHYSW
jgi:hypothetical protein